MRKSLCLALLLAGCGLDAPEQKAKDSAVVLDAKFLRVQMDLHRLASEMDQYYSFHNGWPEDWSDLKRAPMLDPWGTEYGFGIEEGRPVVYSAGPDGEDGTDDDLYGG